MPLNVRRNGAFFNTTEPCRMENLEYSLLAALLLAIYLDIVATVSLWQTISLERFQKIAQAVIVWIIPYFGAWLVLYLLARDEPEAVPAHLVGSAILGIYLVPGIRSLDSDPVENAPGAGESADFGGDSGGDGDGGGT